MESILLYIVSIFFVIGAIDYIEDNRFKLGSSFEAGIKSMGSLALSMIGILSLTPFLLDQISNVLITISNKILIDPSIFLGSIIAVDMGGYNLCSNLANDSSMRIFSGILISSILGCTISFTLPLSIGLVKKEELDSLFKGILCGIIAMPIGLFVGGLMLKLSIIKIIYNLLPIILLSIFIGMGILFKTSQTVFIFDLLGKIIRFIGMIGIIVQGVKSICGVELLKNIMPIQEVLLTVGKIAIFLSGAYVMIEFIKKALNKYLKFIESRVKINQDSILALIGSLASAIIIFDSFEKLDYKGKVICSAFSVGGAYVFGGQLGYVAGVEPSMLNVYVITKLLCGIIGVIIAIIFLKYENKG
ncbi:ethanolamine utilization protein EutH [Clostridium neonatale]|uniref:ethanolamine utilization protein EutH n=1 Tax=Clostridium neonatale TaxID=137838 RepID=UPI00291B4ABE|nr:ethanolamine utilization protein EutH [Clostridium neonatale]CAI3674287.1 putative ethanolamine permease EutH [Clostridium neonatale]CAI3675774.1 putative ethanolamine permease EutH [Clostridium neonatale]